MAVLANPLVVRIFINSTLTGRSSGWAERWPIVETNWDRGLVVALAMVQARQRVLSQNAYIQWGCLGTVTPPYYEQTVVTDPLFPLPQWGNAAFDMQGILFALNAPDGENAPRLIKAVDADEISAKRWKYADMLIPSIPPALPADLTTAPKDLLWQNSLATLRQYAATQQPMSDGHHGEGDGYWVVPFGQIVYKQMSSRRWGPAWKRMSWEAVPYANAPQFSPCGTVVTVNRISYQIPCRFGEDWTLRNIHYYVAKLGADVMTFKTPFCCWDRSKEYTDFSGVGEARKFRRSDWREGNSYGNAPGTMWTGPRRYFAGFAPEPPIPTPSFMLPTCDAPVPPCGLVYGGSAETVYTPLPPPGSPCGLVFSGEADTVFTPGPPTPPPCGLVYGGQANTTWTAGSGRGGVSHASGGIVLCNTAVTTFQRHHTSHASGGIVLGNTATSSAMRRFTSLASGGLVLGDTATSSFTPGGGGGGVSMASGGIVLGTSASTTFTPGGGGSPPTVVQAMQKGGSAPFGINSSLPVAVTAGNMVVVLLTTAGFTGTPNMDSRLTLAYSQSTGGGGQWVYYQNNVAASVVYTINLTGFSGNFETAILEVMGQNVSTPFDVQAANNGSGGSWDSGTTANTANANELVIAFGVCDVSGSIINPPPAGWTAVLAGMSVLEALYQNSTVIGAQNVGLALSATPNWGGMIFTIKP